MLMHLVYVSSATSWPTEKDLRDLLVQARKKNIKYNITGMLLYNNATYIQVLEGEDEDVHEIYKAIKNDPRNNAVVTILEEPIAQRSFPDWSMGYKKIEDGDSEELPGFIEIFNGKLDRDIATNNKDVTIGLLMGFAKRAKK